MTYTLSIDVGKGNTIQQATELLHKLNEAYTADLLLTPDLRYPTVLHLVTHEAPFAFNAFHECKCEAWQVVVRVQV